MLAFNAVDSVVPAFQTDHLQEEVLMVYTYFIKKVSISSRGHLITRNTTQSMGLTKGNKNVTFSVLGCGGERAGRGSKMFNHSTLL